VIELAVGDLPRRAAEHGIDDEDVRVTLFHRAGPVARPRQAVDDHRAPGPLGAARALRQLHLEQRLLVGNGLCESNLFPVRGPRDAGRRPLHVGQLRDFAGVDVHDVQLRGAVAIGQERDARRVRRPDRRAVAPVAAGQLPHPAAVGLDQPQVAAGLVLHLVAPRPRKDDAPAVGGDGGGAEGLHVQERVLVEKPGGLRGGAGRECREHEDQRKGAREPAESLRHDHPPESDAYSGRGRKLQNARAAARRGL
jgi:hypothetical protein